MEYNHPLSLIKWEDTGITTQNEYENVIKNDVYDSVM